MSRLCFAGGGCRDLSRGPASLIVCSLGQQNPTHPARVRLLFHPPCPPLCRGVRPPCSCLFQFSPVQKRPTTPGYICPFGREIGDARCDESALKARTAASSAVAAADSGVDRFPPCFPCCIRHHPCGFYCHYQPHEDKHRQQQRREE